MIIDGIPDAKTDPKLSEIQRAHRVGKYDPTGRPRLIVVKLLQFKDKDEILKQAKYLKSTNFFINEDFSKSVCSKLNE